MIRSRVRARGGIIQWFLSSAYKADSVSPSLILDFANNRYAANSSAKNFSDILTFTRGSTGTYFDSSGVMQTAAADVPRFDCDPATGVAKGLLVEDTRTNLLTQTMSFASGWSFYRSTTSTDGAVAAPTGDLGVLKIIPQDNLSNANQSISVTSGVTYTVSFYAKSVSGTKNVRAGIYNGYSAIAGSDFEINDSSWTRVYYTFTATSTISYQMQLRNGSAGGVGGFYIWGGQCEAGSFPSSYIPTTSSAVTRAADIVTNTSSNTVKFADWYNQSEGTVVASHSPVISSGVISQIDDTTNDNRLLLNAMPDGAQQFVAVGGGTLVNSFTTGISSGYYKTAGAYKLNDFAVSTNGSAVVTDTAGTIPSVSRMTIGSRTGGMHLFGTIKELLFYPIRVTDSEMQRITNA